MAIQSLQPKMALILFTAIAIADCQTGNSHNAQLSAPDPTHTTWAIDSYKITVNNVPFFANGVSYSPTPWGNCTAFVPYGDFTINTWQSVWQRDLALMRANGINLLKTYNTLDSAQLVAGGNPSTWDHDHKLFLDACWNNGEKPVYVLMGYAPPKNQQNIFITSDWNLPANRKAREAIKTDLINLATTWGKFPAVMGFVMANEVNANNIINNSLFFKYWNDVARAVDSVVPGKLVTLANVDDGMNTVDSGNVYMTARNFFWGINSYRGNWTNSNGFDVLFSSFQTATAGNPHPLMLTEWGAPASTHGNSGQMQSLDSSEMQHLVAFDTGHYANMLANRSDNGTGVCCGGTYFEWSDEWWKADPPGMQCNQPNAAPACHTGIWDPGPNSNKVAGFPGQYWDEEGFGLFAIKPANPASRVPVVKGGCVGAWDPASNSPYPPDTLIIRLNAQALFTYMQYSSHDSTGIGHLKKKKNP